MTVPTKASARVQAYEYRADRSQPGWQPDWDASLGLFFITGPFHPFWHWWAVTLCHLRDLPNVRPARKHYDGAEYEFSIWSLAAHRHGDQRPFKLDELNAVDNRWSQYALTPADVVKQFDVGTMRPVEERDRIARRILDLAVDAIVDGKMSPDSDYRSWWKRAIDETVEHELAGGLHRSDGRSH